MKYPYKKLALPSVLKDKINGKLDDALLASVKTGGKMLKGVADHFNSMYDEAKAAGITLRNIGDYRSFDSQLKMFMERYSTKDDGRKPEVTRTFEGKTWYLKKGMAPSATPDPTGKSGSNHGWGLAIDLGVSDKKGALIALAADKKALQWMCENAPRFGFFMQTDDVNSKNFEAWHWQYCEGDAQPPYKTGDAPAPDATLKKARRKMNKEGA